MKKEKVSAPVESAEQQPVAPTSKEDAKDVVKDAANDVKKNKKQIKVKTTQKFDVFKILKSRYFVFVFLTIVIILAAFCLLLMDTENYFRKQFLPFLDNVTFLKDIFKLFGVKEAEAGQGVSITTWLFFFVGFGLFYIGFIVWAFFTPIKEKVVYNAKYNEYVINKRKTIYNIVFFGLAGIAVAGYVILLIAFFPWKDVNFSDGKKVADNFLNFIQCLGILLLLFLIPIVALIAIMLIFKLLVAIFVFFAGSVSKGVMKTQGYQEALATSQIINARLQKEALKELDKDAPLIVTNDASRHVEDMVDSGDYGNYKSSPKYIPLDALGELQQRPLSQQKLPDCIFPALTAIDIKHKDTKINESDKANPLSHTIASAKEKNNATTTTTDAKTKKIQISKFNPKNDPKNVLKDFAIRFQAYLANKNDLYFSLEIIRAFIAGLNASRIILLEGLSGTGKTTLPRVFNEFVGGKSAFFPVQATWRDRSDIIGYYSDFTKQFKETEFLKTLYEASYTPKKFNLMVLDEMNISRVEYYFADFLSILEYPKEEWLIPLINSADQSRMPKQLDNGKILIPTNTWFVGTINVDDSTFTVSDKVYDRVIVIDFRELSIPFTSKADDSKWNMTPKELQEAFNYVTNSDLYHLAQHEKIKFINLCEFTGETFDIRFGNRVMNQIYNFVPVYVALGGAKEEALDFMFARKILRKIEGKYENYISVGLTKLAKYLQTSYGKGHFKETEAYIEKLRKKLM